MIINKMVSVATPDHVCGMVLSVSVVSIIIFIGSIVLSVGLTLVLYIFKDEYYGYEKLLVMCGLTVFFNIFGYSNIMEIGNFLHQNGIV